MKASSIRLCCTVAALGELFAASDGFNERLLLTEQIHHQEQYARAEMILREALKDAEATDPGRSSRQKARAKEYKYRGEAILRLASRIDTSKYTVTSVNSSRIKRRQLRWIALAIKCVSNE